MASPVLRSSTRKSVNEFLGWLAEVGMWSPIDVYIRTSDIAHVINMLGIVAFEL